MPSRSRQFFQILILIQITLLLNTDEIKVFADNLPTNNISNNLSLIPQNGNSNISNVTTNVASRNPITGFVNNTDNKLYRTRPEATNETWTLDNQRSPPLRQNADDAIAAQGNKSVQNQQKNFTTVRNVTRNTGNLTVANGISMTNSTKITTNYTSSVNKTLYKPVNRFPLSGPSNQTNETSTTSGFATRRPSPVYGNRNQTSYFPGNTTARNSTGRTYYQSSIHSIPRFMPPTNLTGRKNASSWMDPNFNPTRWLLKVQAPWKHVSGNISSNATSVVQVCKFQDRFAICSAEYTSSTVFEKLWLQVEEAEGRKGVDITAFEKGHTPRVIFRNRANGTACQRFENGTFHQICVKVYGYDKALGPTRVCLQVGAALFNHGVASSDFGCFRYGSLVRHEDPMDGESPNPRLLNTYILSNDYSNVIETRIEDSTSASSTRQLFFSSLLTSLLIPLIFLPIY